MRVSMKSTSTSAAMSFLFVFSVFTASQAQDKNKITTQPHYLQVVERAFQFSGGTAAEFSGYEYKIVARYLPSCCWPESQFVLLANNNNVIRAVEYRLKEGTRPISDIYNETLRQNPHATLDDILKSVSIEKVDQ